MPGDEKTEAPTPRRRQQARSNGQVARSNDLPAAIIMLGGLLLLDFRGRHILGRLIGMVRAGLGDTGSDLTDINGMVPSIANFFREMAAIVLPLMILVVVLAILSNLAQVGWLLTAKTLMPSLNKLNPVSGLKRMFSARAFMLLAMGIAKMSMVVLVAYLTLRSRVDMFAQASALHHLTMVGMAADLFFMLGVRLAAVLLLLAIIDFIYQRYKTEKELKMTKEEVKDEMKSMEGDPKVKQRRRQVQMEMVIQRINAAVPQADVVVTNPTSFAVAIQYDAAKMTAPKVTAKGVDHLARRIRELAIAHGVPIVERPPLARALYRSVEVGQEIPAQFYRAVAEILAYVYELSGRREGRRTPAPAAAMS